MPLDSLEAEGVTQLKGVPRPATQRTTPRRAPANRAPSRSNCSLPPTRAMSTVDLHVRFHAKTDETSILADTAKAIDGAIDRILKGHDEESGLLARGYEVFLTE